MEDIGFDLGRWLVTLHSFLYIFRLDSSVSRASALCEALRGAR